MDHSLRSMILSWLHLPNLLTHLCDFFFGNVRRLTAVRCDKGKHAAGNSPLRLGLRSLTYGQVFLGAMFLSSRDLSNFLKRLKISVMSTYLYSSVGYCCVGLLIQYF